MSQQLPDLVARVRMDTSDLDRTVRGPKARGVGLGLSRSIGGGFRASIGSSLRNAMGAAVAVIGVAALGRAVKSFTDDARESARISRITEARIRSTGKAAGLSADQVGDLAQRLSDKTGADDEAIQSGQNLLLTFTNVRNEAGKGRDIFTQASQAAIDLAASMHDGEVSADGLKGANIQLGKALNDPVKGITALTRVGVSFTEKQKEQIKTLVETGRTTDAQRLILAELRKEFGGTAAASADAGDRLSVTWGNIKEDIGAKLLPVLENAQGAVGSFLTAVSGKGFEADTGLQRFAGRAGQKLRALGRFIRDEVIPEVARFRDFLRDDLAPALQDVSQRVGPDLISTLSTIVSTLRQMRRALGTTSSSTDDMSNSTVGLVEILGGLLQGVLFNVRTNVRLLGVAFRVAMFQIRLVVNQALRILDFFLAAVETAVSVAAKIPGPWQGAMRKVRDQVSSARDQIEALRRAANGVKSPPPLTVRIQGGQAAINEIADLRFQLNNIPRSVTVNVLNKVQNIPQRAGGGQVRAGMAFWAGEQGRELVRLTAGGGAIVTPHAASEQVARGGGGDGQLARAVLALARRPVQVVLDRRVVAETVDRSLGSWAGA